MIQELETSLLGPTDVVGIIGVLAEKKRVTVGGYCRFELIDTSEGYVVAAAGRNAECHRFQEAARGHSEKYEAVLRTIEHLKTQQNGLMTPMERKNRMTKGVLE